MKRIYFMMTLFLLMSIQGCQKNFFEDIKEMTKSKFNLNKTENEGNFKKDESEEIRLAKEYLKYMYNITKYEDEIIITAEPGKAEMYSDLFIETDHAMSTLGYTLIDTTSYSDATEYKYKKMKKYKLKNNSSEGFFKENKVSENREKMLYEEDSTKIPYETYYNPRFKFSVDYPTKYFEFLAESQNGDGRAMVSKDKQVYMSFSAMYNVLSTTIEEEYNKDLNDYAIYKNLGEKSYTISFYGEHGEIVFVKKIYDEIEDKYVTLYFEYDEAYKDFMTPIIERMTSSVRENITR